MEGEIHMKKIIMIAGAILAVIVIGIFLINIKEQETDVTKEQTKVGVLLNGDHLDKSWGQSHYEGLEISAAELNLDMTYRESVPMDESCITVMEELIGEGCEIIICNSFDYGQWITQVAKAHPEVYFFHATGVGAANNLSTYFGRIYQMRYLSGIVAGLQTETNEIGYVAAFPISEVNRGINAFTLGVRKVNPNATVYVEWSNSWTGEKENSEATEKLLGNHDIDVLTIHMDTNCALDIADERGIWTIGYNMDNSGTYPDTFLTAPVWRWENFYKPRVLECLQGKFHGQHYWEGVESGMVDLAPLTDNVKPGITELVEQERERLQSGMFDVFYGAIIDQQGELRVPEGESMSDYSMLNEFDWYVEGVKINGEE